MGKEKSYLEESCTKLVLIDIVCGLNLPSVGSTAESSGFSDPYCKVEIKDTKFAEKTQYIEQNNNPQWNESFEWTVRDNKVHEIQFTVYDKEFGHKDVEIGKASFDFGKMQIGDKKETRLSLNGKGGQIEVVITLEEGGVDLKQAKEIERNILKNLEKGQKWEDPNFFGNSALFVNPAQPTHDLDRVEWKRPSEYAEKPQLFVEGVEAGDVIQGQLGDCYFLGAISTLATRDDLLKPIVVAAHPEAGFYQFKFFKNSEWQVVTIDDRLPVRGRRPIYANCKDANETWVPLIEKAYAKLHGSYQALNGGLTSNALTDLTGEFCSNFQFKDIQKELQSGAWWQKLLWFIKEEYLMGVACNSASKEDTEADNGMGILKNHAYGLLECKEPLANLRLLSIRNPWGQLEWKGDYSDKSDKWTPELRKACNAKDEEDGIFWMTYDDWMKNFSTMTVLRLLQDQVGERWHRYAFSGKWKGLSAGGCSNFITWNKNPQYAIRTKEATKIFVSISQPDRRMHNQGNRYPHAISFALYKHDSITKPKMVKIPTDEVGDTSFAPSREVTQEFDLPADSTFVLVPSTFNPGEESRFWVNVFSQKKLDHADEVLPYKPQLVSGEWKGKSAGGCANNETWLDNPIFVIDAPNAQQDNAFPIDVTVTVLQKKVPELIHIGMYCGKYEKKKPSQQSEIKNERQCINAPSISLDLQLKQEDLPMWILPHTFYAGKETSFELSLGSRSGFTIAKLQ